MIVHKILTGQDAGKYLPFALSRLALLEKINPNGFFTQRYLIEGYYVTVQKFASLRYIWIVATGGVYFEFQTTGLPVEYWPFAQGSITSQAYKAGVVGVTISKGVATAKLLGGRRVEHTVDTSRIGRSNQVILLDEPVHYYSSEVNNKPSQNYSRMLYDTWAPGHSHTGLHFHSYAGFFQILSLHTLRGSFSSHFLRDVGYDVAWSDNVDFNPIREADLVEGTDWPRKAGVQLVRNEQYGDREFAIYIDAFDQISVFPTSEITASGADSDGLPLQNVEAGFVKTARVPFPAWVYKKSMTFKDWHSVHGGGDAYEATGLFDFPEYDWNIHPDGTKMCAVVYEREAAEFNSAYYGPFETPSGTQGPGSFYPTQTSFDLMNAYALGVTSLSNGARSPGDTYYMGAPGLLEVNIAIAINGAQPGDYTLDVTCTEVRRPTTSAYCTFLAGYSWFDVRATDYTDEVPTYDAQRGDLCVLDIEHYGRLSDGKAASLYSLKNITQNKEIKTFGGSSTFTSGSLFTGVPGVVAYNMETLSFVFKYRLYELTASSPPKVDGHFGISVYTNNKYRDTFFPDLLDATKRNSILAKVDQDHRAAMNLEFGAGMELMPLNDLRDWTDATLGRLREYYCRSTLQGEAETYGAYSPPITPFANPDISTKGYKYWKNGTFEFSAPTTEMYNWYNHIVREGQLEPYVLFDLVTPRPGWWQYMGQIMQRCELNPHTTFFTHPNGSWAFFSQSFIYNKNGMHVVTIGDAGLGTSEWDPANMEHCIFDKVHFSVWENEQNVVIDTSFRELYNQAITNGQDDGSLTDNSQQIELADMRASWTAGTIADPYDGTVTYAQMRADWPIGFTTYFRETGYYSGTKGAGGASFDATPGGGALDLSFATLWKDGPTDGAALIPPDAYHTPITFSTCVLITK